MKKLLGILAVTLGASLYGGLNSVVKLAYEAGYSFTQITSSQYIYGSLILFVMVIMFKAYRTVSIHDFIKISLVGVIGLGGTSVFLYGSLNQVPTSIALVLLFQFTWICLVIERIFLEKKVNRGQLLSVIIILIGTLCVLQIFGLKGFHLSWLGIIYGFLAAISYSVFLIGASILPHTIPEVYKTSVMTVVTLVILMIAFSFVVPIQTLNPLTGIWRWGLLLGVLGQILPPLLFNFGAPIVGGTVTALLGSAELPVGVLLSSLMVGEAITNVQWLGVFLILGGMILGSLLGTKQK